MTEIISLECNDVRFPTSLKAHGSDAMHTDPDYSCAYVTVRTAGGHQGYGLTFTIGRGTEIVVQAVKSLSFLVLKKRAYEDIFKKFGEFWRELTSESQLRWLGPEKGVMHLAAAAIVNALWDLWARMEKKPLWKLLVDLSTEELLSCIDFRYTSNVMTRNDAFKILMDLNSGKEEREAEMRQSGYPAYTTQAGWLGYSPEKVRQQCEDLMQKGFTAFKIKVGQDLQSDIERCKMVREIIGDDKILMVDANQRWEVQEAIDWMKPLAPFKPLWIEEPTSPDDILGHAQIAEVKIYFRKNFNFKQIVTSAGPGTLRNRSGHWRNVLQQSHVQTISAGEGNEILPDRFMPSRRRK
ncbi:Hypothetical predicted protein [Cloeon dipterum]|uniref:Mandelate racemase/muconate lactonizing enzyme C-terminal domain-containing protein n=1 Tax=Cloeon dipterum TaxID=197152 RepID=A0A8S1CPD0_9INSE|nr:Hypothetical predicted protein [Cloeon dipterum]